MEENRIGETFEFENESEWNAVVNALNDTKYDFTCYGNKTVTVYGKEAVEELLKELDENNIEYNICWQVKRDAEGYKCYEYERKLKKGTIYRIMRDSNGFMQHQYKSTNETENPSYNGGWSTDYEGSVALSVNVPYPYTVPSNYYYRRHQGDSYKDIIL